jgi:hypothetical protein
MEMARRTLLICTFCIFSPFAHAFTLISSTGAHFPVSDVPIDYNDSSCSSAFTTAQLTSYIEGAIGQYWNSIPSAGMKLSLGNSSTSAPSFGNPLVNNRILVVCRTSWSGGASALAVGTMSWTSTQTGGLMDLNIGGGSADLRNTSDAGKIRVIAHEMGHALGLGHSDKDYALMYFQLVSQSGISEDDEAGFTYLYPSSMSNAFTNCAGIQPPNSNDTGLKLEFVFTALYVAIAYAFVRIQPIKIAK